MTVTALPGLDGVNPLAYLSALGALVACHRMSDKPVRLSWSVGLENIPELHGLEMEEIVDCVIADREQWHKSPALEFLLNGTPIDDVKFASASEVRGYLTACCEVEDQGRSLALAQALVCEFAVDRSGQSKPTDLHFTAGRQLFMRMTRLIRDGVTAEDVARALHGPWTMSSDLPSVMWDVGDDRVYALTGRKPSGEKKQTEPGAEWLAIMGMSLYGIHRSPTGRVGTPGSGGSWKKGSWTWPLWGPPLSINEVGPLINHSELVSADNPTKAQRLTSMGVLKVLTSTILRADQGGAGSFRPPAVAWQRPRP